MALRGYPGIHAGMPTPQGLRSASVVLRGAKIKIKSKSKSKASPLPHWISSSHSTDVDQIPCGSELAREEASTSNIIIDCSIAFASRLAPTGGDAIIKEPGRPQTLIISRTFAVSRSNVNGLVIICMPESRKPPRTAACSA